MASIEQQEPHQNPWSTDACPANREVISRITDHNNLDGQEGDLGCVALQSGIRGNFFQEESKSDLVLDPLVERFKRIQEQRETASRPIPKDTAETPSDGIRRALISRQRKKLGR